MESRLKVPVVITVYADRSFTFETKTPPAADLLKKAAGDSKASSSKRGKGWQVTRGRSKRSLS